MTRRHGGGNTLWAMTLAAVAAPMPVHAAAQPPAPADVGHATFYGTCAALIIAVLVVLYFDEKIIPADQHRPAVIYLGTVLGAVLLIPVLVLAGFMPDTSGTREALAGSTVLFLVGGFGAAVTHWGREDGRRLAEARRPRPVPAWDASAVLLPPPETTAAALTERERAAQAFAAALHVARLFSPDLVAKFIDAGQLQQEAERQAQAFTQWTKVEPVLLAISAGYPSAAVRHQVAAFDVAAAGLMRRASELLAAAREGLRNHERAERAQAAQDAVVSVAREWDKLIKALHAHERGRRKAVPVPVPRGRAAARKPKAARNGRTGATN